LDVVAARFYSHGVGGRTNVTRSSGADARTSRCVLNPLSPTDIKSVPSSSPSRESSTEFIHVTKRAVFPNRADGQRTHGSDRELGTEREVIGILVARSRSGLLAAGTKEDRSGRGRIDTPDMGLSLARAVRTGAF
jgi:hypothetical protein